MAKQKLKKSDFNAGSPYSSWLKEELLGELFDYLNKTGGSIIKKYNAKATPEAEWVVIREMRKFDDLPVEWQKVATEIINKTFDFKP